MQEVSRSYDQADENARQVVRRTRNVTRRKYTPEEKVRIVIEGIRGEISVSALCRREGINSSGPHHQDSGEAKIRESTAGVSRKPSSDGKARGCSSKQLCGLTAWNT